MPLIRWIVRDGDPRLADPPATGDGLDVEVPAVESFVGLRTKALAESMDLFLEKCRS